MKIKITEFAERHFDPKFGGTKIKDKTKEEFEEAINQSASTIELGIENKAYSTLVGCPSLEFSSLVIHEGYAPFCKLVAIHNFTDARVGSMPITLENYQYLRSGYSARRDSELPIFSRWLDLPLGKPKAEWLVLVLYSREQILKEEESERNNPTKWPKSLTEKPEPFDADWGIVAILGQSHPNEEPMKPETMIRNSMGTEYGGSGVELDREAYLKSVEFWDKNVTVK